MKKFYILLLFFLPVACIAQHVAEMIPFYETINAKYVVKHTGDLGLKGNVRSVKETLDRKQIPDPKDEDSVIITRYLFTADGLLNTLSKGDSLKELNNSGAYYEVYNYDEKSRRLKEFVVHNGGYYASVVTKTFNPEGFLAKERFDARFKENANLFHYTATYTYPKKFSEVSIHYKYDQPSEQYERLKDVQWRFVFDAAGLLTSENRGYTDFSSSTGFMYDPKLKLPVNIMLQEHCATQNSCLFLVKSIAYNAKGFKISESLTDHTIRNSMWNYDYCYQYAYNEHGDLSKKITCTASKQNLFQPSKAQQRMAKPSLKSPAMGYEYDYVYDASGNWIEKKEYMLDAGKRTGVVSVTKREIGYW